MNRLAELLEAERAKRDLTLTDFAEQVLGISHSLVSRYVNGVQSPNRRTVRKIASALDVAVAEIDALLADEDAKRRGRHVPGRGPTGTESAASSRPGPGYVTVDTGTATVRLTDPRLVSAFYGFLERWPRMTAEEAGSLLADETEIPDPDAGREESADAGGGGSRPGGAPGAGDRGDRDR